MILVLSIVMATSVWMTYAGIVLRLRLSLSARVDPYLGREDRLYTLPTRVLRSIVGRLPSTGERSVRERLSAAGSRRSAEAFRLEQVTWGLILAAGSGAALLAMSVAGAGADARALPVVLVVAFVTGALARDWWLTRQVSARLDRLVAELPIAIDLITLSVMAGESVPSALMRVASTLPAGVGAEFASVVGDVRAGAPVVQALETLGRHVPEPSMTRLIDALCSAIEKGSPLADVLRAQAEDGRELRRRMLLEMGGRREVWMLVPVVFLIMPVVVIFALYPGLISLGLLVP